MWIIVPFYDVSGPVTGLNPTINIKDIETNLLVVSGTMTDINDGFYTYDFSLYDLTKKYSIFCDSLILTGSYRYKSLNTDDYGRQLNNINMGIDNSDIKVGLLKRLLVNRLELVNGSINNFVLYNDDSATPLLTYSVTDRDSDIIVQVPHVVSKRAKGV